MSDELKRRELQPLRDYLRELGPDAKAAIEEWAAEHEYTLQPVIMVRIPDPALMGAGGGGAGGEVRIAIGTSERPPSQGPEGIVPWLRQWMGARP